jgi:hypothetical protein
MDVKLRTGSLEYNTIGGILDLYFIGGSDGKTGPADVSRGYAKLVRTIQLEKSPETDNLYRPVCLLLFRTGVSGFINAATVTRTLSM